jgi:hypothetical protein
VKGSDLLTAETDVVIEVDGGIELKCASDRRVEGTCFSGKISFSGFADNFPCFDLTPQAVAVAAELSRTEKGFCGGSDGGGAS